MQAKQKRKVLFFGMMAVVLSLSFIVHLVPLSAHADTDYDYVVSFDLCGGEGSIPSQYVNHGDYVTDPQEYEEYVDKYNTRGIGWWEKADGSMWHFNLNTVTSDMTLYAHWTWNNSYMVEKSSPEVLGRTVEQYLQQKFFGSYNWTQTAHNSTLDIYGDRPVEIGGTCYRNEYKQAVYDVLHYESYGGCGPKAMIGIIDYFARYHGYNELIPNPGNITDRYNISYEVVNTTRTSANPNPNVRSEDMLSSGSGGTRTGDGTITTLPADYDSAFNTIMENHGVDSYISCQHHQSYLLNENSLRQQIKNSIDSGVPATIYSADNAPGDFAEHYFNVYGYTTYSGKDRTGSNITTTLYEARINFGQYENLVIHCDSDILKALICGIITYDVHYHNYTYEYVSHLKHRYTCSCGKTGLEYHTYPLGINNRIIPFFEPDIVLTCIKCGGGSFEPMAHSCDE